MFYYDCIWPLSKEINYALKRGGHYWAAYFIRSTVANKCFLNPARCRRNNAIFHLLSLSRSVRALCRSQDYPAKSEKQNQPERWYWKRTRTESSTQVRKHSMEHFAGHTAGCWINQAQRHTAAPGNEPWLESRAARVLPQFCSWRALMCRFFSRMERVNKLWQGTRGYPSLQLVLQWPWQLPMYSYGAAGLPITLKMPWWVAPARYRVVV